MISWVNGARPPERRLDCVATPTTPGGLRPKPCIRAADPFVYTYTGSVEIKTSR